MDRLRSSTINSLRNMTEEQKFQALLKFKASDWNKSSLRGMHSKKQTSRQVSSEEAQPIVECLYYWDQIYCTCRSTGYCTEIRLLQDTPLDLSFEGGLVVAKRGSVQLC